MMILYTYLKPNPMFQDHKNDLDIWKVEKIDALNGTSNGTIIGKNIFCPIMSVEALIELLIINYWINWTRPKM
jgi:hypothetical protein